MSQTPLIKRILKQFADWREKNQSIDPKAESFGYRIEYRQGDIYDGVYGVDEEDTRPDFVKRDEIGWTRLK